MDSIYYTGMRMSVLYIKEQGACVKKSGERLKVEKAREIAMYAMRDKVVQQSVAAELGKLYEESFPDSACAYRKGRSALHTLQKLEQFLENNRDCFYLKMDITGFFDHIDQEILEQILRKRIREEDVLEIIKETWKAKGLSEDGTVHSKEVGIYQGSGLAPVLSNIYLQEFDERMESRCAFYVRYSDDMLVLDKQREALEEILAYSRECLAAQGLLLKEEKTALGEMSEGFEFLGHRFDAAGKSIPVKAEAGLKERLETMWIEQMHWPLEEKLKKGAEILGGWEQYFREEREIGSMIEYAVVVYMTKNRSQEAFQKLQRERTRFRNDFLDIHKYLVQIWKACGNQELELLEYEQMHGLHELDLDVAISEQAAAQEQILGHYREMGVLAKEEHYKDLIQAYADLSCYEKASALTEECQRFLSKGSSRFPPTLSLANAIQGEVLLDENQLMNYMELFAGREDLYAEEALQADGKCMFTPIMEPLTEKVIRNHLKGVTTICTYVQRANNTAKYLILDIDISKSILLQMEEGTKEFELYLEQAGEYALAIQQEVKRLGLTAYVEQSGFRGFHVWVFFSEWIPTRYVNLLSGLIEDRTNVYKKEGINLEIFPNKTRIRANKFGQAIRLPLGIHMRSGKRSRFMDESAAWVEDYGDFLGAVIRHSCAEVKRILGTCLSKTVQMQQARVVDADLTDFGELAQEVRVVLEKCTLTRYLCQKARKTGYLSHFERLTVLYIFGHLGEEGKEFVHTVMRFTLNYQYQITERFIQKLPEKPISCLKLREQYKQVTAEYGCSCNFQRTKNCYPSPVLHAIQCAEVGEGSCITMPTSRTMTKEKEKTVYEEINAHKKAQELATQILELKKQKRKIDKSILNIEKELKRVFDSAQTDCLEIDMGLLIRRKKEEGEDEWVIEI